MFGTVPIQQINVHSLTRISTWDRAKIGAVDPALRLTDARSRLDGEYRETRPAFTAARYLGGRPTRHYRARTRAT